MGSGRPRKMKTPYSDSRWLYSFEQSTSTLWNTHHRITDSSSTSVYKNNRCAKWTVFWAPRFHLKPDSIWESNPWLVLSARGSPWYGTREVGSGLEQWKHHTQILDDRVLLSRALARYEMYAAESRTAPENRFITTVAMPDELSFKIPGFTLNRIPCGSRTHDLCYQHEVRRDMEWWVVLDKDSNN